jgi:hypothetical protein
MNKNATDSTGLTDRAPAHGLIRKICGIRGVFCYFQHNKPAASRGIVWAVLVILLLGVSAQAQSNQLWPEISTFVKLTDQMRFYFLATTVKENRDSIEGEFGPNFDFYLKPLRKLDRWVVSSPDESKNRLLMVRIGYRYIHPYSDDGSNEHRGVLEATTRHPLPFAMLVSDRHRMDLRSIEGEFSWRYRNRLTVEKEFTIKRFRFNPYARGEIWYDSRHDKVSRTSLIAGSSFPITRHFELEGYLEHQNDSGGSSNRSVNGVGVVANLYF